MLLTICFLDWNSFWFPVEPVLSLPLLSIDSSSMSRVDELRYSGRCGLRSVVQTKQNKIMYFVRNNSPNWSERSIRLDYDYTIQFM